MENDRTGIPLENKTMEIETIQRKRPGVKHMTKHNMRVDMTPMVDLGFLLITFFVITTELSRPKAMDLIMPADGTGMPTPESKTITLLAGASNKLFYYFGEEKDAGTKNPIVRVAWDEQNGIGNVISQKQLSLGTSRKELMIIIKPGKESTYKNVVDLLDEMLIHEVSRYAVVKPGIKEEEFLEKNKD